jgi:hypothetical protein
VALVEVGVHLEKARKDKLSPEVSDARPVRHGAWRGVAHLGNDASFDQHVAFAPWLGWNGIGG